MFPDTSGEDQTKKNFMAGLMIPDLSRELFSVADEHDGKLPSRVVFSVTSQVPCPPSTSCPAILHGGPPAVTPGAHHPKPGQLEELWQGGAEILTDNCQDTIFGGFAPNSQTAEVLSKALGNRTVWWLHLGKERPPARASQMIERPHDPG